MKDRIAQLQRELTAAPLESPAQRQQFKQRYLASDGEIAGLCRQLPKLARAEKRVFGPLLQELKKMAQARHQGAQAPARSAPAPQKREDLTLPPTYERPGNSHPITQIQEKVTALLARIGFVIAEGPEVEDEWHNFTALNIPPHHPARQMQDTFFIQGKKELALRAHTSSVQVRILEEGNLPVRILSLGRVFRHETISTRAHAVFHQVEALYVDKDVTFVDLKKNLHYFVQEFFGPATKMRLRPSYFPFTEPSAEVDIACLLCRGKGCSICKQSGWVEIGGAGLVDPHVLKQCRVDPDKYRGYAFGLGLERLAMLLYKIPDVRLFTENHQAFLQQFKQPLS